MRLAWWSAFVLEAPAAIHSVVGILVPQRNDASVIAYLSKYAGLVGSGDRTQAATGAAVAQHYAGQIHDTLMAGLPAKSVIASFQAQLRTATTVL